MWKIVLLVELATLSYTPSNIASDSQVAHVTLQAIQCRQGYSETPTLLLAPATDFPRLQYSEEAAQRQQVSEGYSLLTFTVAEGNYFFKVVSSHCIGSLQTAVLVGHKRTLSLALVRRIPDALFEGNLKLVESENALAGSLAITPSVAYLVAITGGKRVLDVQDGAYYLDRVRPAKYILRMELHGGFQSDIPLDLSGISETQLFKRDLNIVDVRQHLGNIRVTGGASQDCDWCY